MGLFDRLKNVLFEDDEEIIDEEKKEIEETKVKVSSEPVIEPRFKTSKQEEKINKIPEEKKVVKEVQEKEIFQTFDEEEFDRIAAINRNRLLERDRKAREAKEEEKRLKEKEMQKQMMAHQNEIKKTVEMPKREEERIERTERIDSYRQVKEVQEKPRQQQTHNYQSVAPKRFTPSPVISPVYGVLDKNYKKEDILPRASSDGTLPKIVDVDNVRKKAFGVLEEQIKKNEPLNKFESDEEMGLEDIADELDANVEIKKIDEIDNNYEDDLDTPIVSLDDYPKSKKKEIPEDTLEKDLFNLIDSMYETREEE